MPVKTRSQSRDQISHTAYKLVFVEPLVDKTPYNILGIAELGIPTFGRNNETRIVHNSDYAKYRCDRAFVKKITSLDGNIEYCQAYSVFHNGGFYYTGHWIEADNYLADIQEVCCPGIHYYLNKNAIYNLVHSCFYKNPTQFEYQSVYDINTYVPFNFRHGKIIWFDDDGMRKLKCHYSPKGFISMIVSYDDNELDTGVDYFSVKHDHGRYTVYNSDRTPIHSFTENQFDWSQNSIIYL